jgi:ATPase subunit of ABC transporter with duplicated ATPase domains
VTVERVGKLVLSRIDLTLTTESRLAVIGPNGVGKSTLFAVLAGSLVPDRGEVVRSPERISVGVLRQELDRSAGGTVTDLLSTAVGVATAQAELDAAAAALADGAPGADERYSDALDAWMAIGAADFDTRLEVVADEIGLERRLLELDPAVLSGGQAARVGLAAVMLSRFDITLLDEPTNDLDSEGLDLLERWVIEQPGGLAIISHDRTFLERTVSSVLEIDEHDHTASLFNGGWTSFIEERARKRALAEQRYGEYIAERDGLKAREQQQREWADQGLSQAKKNPADGDKHRRNWQINQTEKLVGKAKATQRAMERLDVVEKPWEGWELRFTIDEAPRSADVVASWGAAVVRRGAWELGPFDLELRWGDRVALVGANGTGKSSLIDALLGRLELVAGSVRLGSGVVVGELDQGRGRLHTDDAPLVEVFQRLTDLPMAETRSVLAKFGLDADAVQRSAASLSPGERTRAQLAQFQASGVNFLVLDEPTNHLDLPAIEQLESALDSFGGTILLVSHDRRFCDAVRLTHSVEIGPQSPS